MEQLDLDLILKITVRDFFQCLKAFQASLSSHILFDTLFYSPNCTDGHVFTSAVCFWSGDNGKMFQCSSVICKTTVKLVLKGNFHYPPELFTPCEPRHKPYPDNRVYAAAPDLVHHRHFLRCSSRSSSSPWQVEYPPGALLRPQTTLKQHT